MLSIAIGSDSVLIFGGVKGLKPKPLKLINVLILNDYLMCLMPAMG